MSPIEVSSRTRGKSTSQPAGTTPVLLPLLELVGTSPELLVLVLPPSLELELVPVLSPDESPLSTVQPSMNSSISTNKPARAIDRERMLDA